MKAFLFLIVVLCTACGFRQSPGGDYLVYIDPDFTLDRQLEIRYAIAEWNAAAEGNLVLTDTASPQGHFVIQIWADHYQTQKNQAGEAVPFTSVIKIQDDMRADLTRMTALHEIGHAVGLDHSETGTIMCKGLSCSSKHLTCADLQQFCRIWKCDSSELAICRAEQ